MAVAEKSRRDERMFLRVTPDQKALLRAAAELEGTTVSAFMARVLLREAQEVVQHRAGRQRSVRDSLTVAQALLAPDEANAALRAAFGRRGDLLGG